jgi:hypothetical protein
LVHEYHFGRPSRAADQPDLFDERLPRLHDPDVFGDVLGGQHRRVEVGVALADHVGRPGAAVKPPFGLVHQPEAVVAVFNEQEHVRQVVEQGEQ